jgi:hypothetical protein
MTLSLAIILASALTGPQPPMAPFSTEYLVQCAMGRSFRFTADARKALVIARSLPVSWHAPEGVASRTLGMGQKEAGRRMILTAPEEDGR